MAHSLMDLCAARGRRVHNMPKSGARVRLKRFSSLKPLFHAGFLEKMRIICDYFTKKASNYAGLKFLQ
jgi:hypothetical protein